MTEKTADYILAPSVTLAAAQRAVAAALEEARSLSIGVCVAVTDSAGHLLAFARMDRAPILCAQIAQDKAYSVAVFGGLPTGEWWPLLESDPPLMHRHHEDQPPDHIRRRCPNHRRRARNRRYRRVRRFVGAGRAGGKGRRSRSDLTGTDSATVHRGNDGRLAIIGPRPARQAGRAGRALSRNPAVPPHVGRPVVLPVSGADHQYHDASDEVYLILRGRGTLRVRDQDHEVGRAVSCQRTTAKSASSPTSLRTCTSWSFSRQADDPARSAC